MFLGLVSFACLCPFPLWCFPAMPLGAVVPCALTPLETSSATQPCSSLQVHNSQGYQGRAYLDVRFRRPARARFLALRNRYAHSITIKARIASATDEAHANIQETTSMPWNLVSPSLQLMANAHAEDDAQRFHVIDLAEVAINGYDKEDIRRRGMCFFALRIYVEQPSPRWRHVPPRVEAVTCYAGNGASREDVAEHHKLMVVGFKDPLASSTPTASESSAAPSSTSALTDAFVAAGRALAL
ncbi:hypothetical protein PPROV_000854300 [Pycnococcus provasolii]|uniref:Uncharacterized protein n=1 Tax=Pycnococcus provasolii TaxID=41880 RepID=A0A830HS46_9CHLO|nr:hypothetical protein PPROV_000854300 [Pycnococcus provasolii]